MNHSTRANPRPIVHSLNRVIFFSLLATIVFTAIPYGTVQPWWIAFFECLVFLIAGLSVIDAAVSKKWPEDWSLVVPLLAFVLFAVVQSMPLFSGPGPMEPRTSLSADPYGTRLFAIQLLALTLVLLLLRSYTSSKARLRKLIYVIIGVGVASALFGIIRQHFQQAPGFLLPGLPIGNRSFGQFINRNHFALLIEMSLGLTLGLIAGEIGRQRRALTLIPVGLFLWVALIYSNSRGGIIASLCQLLFLAVLVFPVRRGVSEQTQAESGSRGFSAFASGVGIRVVLIVCLIGLFVYGVGWIGGEPVVSNFQLAATDFSQQEMENNINTSRREIWSATWRMVKAHPLTGVGFGGYWVGITRFHRASGQITPQQAHNDYLEILASGGLIACGLVLWFLVEFLRIARERLRSPDPYYRAARLGALTGIFGVAIHSFVDFGIHIAINTLVLFALLVIVTERDQLAPLAKPED